MTSRTVWDPFQGALPFAREKIEDPGQGRKIPGWVNTALGLLAIAGTLAIVIAIFWRPAAWFGAPAVAISIGGFFLADYLSKGSKKRDWLFFRLAELNDWAFRLIEPQMRRRRGERGVKTVDPFAARVYKAVPELCRPRPGQLIPLSFQVMYWGETRSGVPFWMGIQQYEVDSTLAVEALKKDAFGGRALEGKLFNMMVSYRLDRDTGIKARLLAEAFDMDGWQNLKTESVEFNRRFNISITEDRIGDGGKLALLRALTPATQTSLIDLHDRYQAQIVIDCDTIHLAGHDRIMSDSDQVVAAHFGMLVQHFAEAATAFRRYVE